MPTDPLSVQNNPSVIIPPLDVHGAEVHPGDDLAGALQPLHDAEKAIAAEYRRRGENTLYSALGARTGEIRQLSDGKHTQKFEFGSVTHTQNIDVPLCESVYAVDIFIAAVKCFGSEDEGGPFGGGEGVDEPYLIITTINPTHAFLDGQVGNVVKTWRSQTFEHIEKGTIFGQEQEVFRNLIIGRHGVSLKIVLMEHEHGDEEKLRQKIEEKGRALAKEVVDAAAALAGVSMDEAVSDQALDSEILRTLGDISVDLITDLLKDDKIDEKTWRLDGKMLKDWVDHNLTETSEVQYPSSELPSHIKTNFPRENVFDQTWLFSGGGGSYKVYLRVIPHEDSVKFRGDQCQN
jgi:hypothetical protein